MILTVVRIAAIAALAALTACGSDDDGSAATATDHVVATTGIWADIAGRVACDGTLEIRTIVPPGGDPHSFEPSLQDREALDGATLVVANGLGLEEALDDTLEQVEDGGVPVFRVGEHVDTIELEGESVDPHVWLDPTRVAAALPALGNGARRGRCRPGRHRHVRGDGPGGPGRARRGAGGHVRPIPDDRRLLVTNHDALGYLADRYGLVVLGSVLPSTSTLTEASPGELDELGRAIDAAGVPAIFTERFSASTDARALADRLGVEIVELHSDALGEAGSGADTYDGLLRTDAAAIAEALSP